MIKLRRNSNPDKWFTVHPEYIKEGEIVELSYLSPLIKGHPSTIFVWANKHLHMASLNCFDYVRKQ